MILSAIQLSTWLVWGLIGIIGGYMSGRLLGSGGSSTVVNVLVGIAGAVLGGWLFVLLFGGSENDLYLSLVASVILCGVFLWLVNSVARSKNGKEEEN